INAHRLAPGAAAVHGGRAKRVHAAVAIIAPYNVEAFGARAASRVQGNHGEAVCSGHVLNLEHDGRRLENISLRDERLPAVGGGSENDVVPKRPYDVESPMGADRAGKPFRSAVVVARQSTVGTDFKGRGPGRAAIG